MMQRGWPAPLCLTAAAMLHASAARAGVWSMDPVLGITGDYASNPLLVELPHTAQSDAAALIDAPTTFNANDFKLSVLPSLRLGDTRSYSSVNSDYEHLSVKAELDTERSVLKATAGVSRDSSLYQNYLTNGEAGVRRDAVLGDLNWDRFLTERVDFDADISTTRVRYGSAAGIGQLVDYKYTSIAPILSWSASPRAKITFSASAGQYDSLDATTRSRNANLQIGFVWQLTAIWSLTATGGFSRSMNRDNFVEYLVLTPTGEEIETAPNGFVLETIPVHLNASSSSSIYSVTLDREGERWTLNATASRQELPTGFAFLSRQNTFELKANYSLSARWSLGADARYVDAEDPQPAGGSVNRTVSYFALNSYWRWTEHWTLTFGASRVSEHYQSARYDLVSNQIAVTLSRRFNHLTFE
jgi:hypothetical protein